MKYLDGKIAEQNGYMKILKENGEICYKKGSGIWIHNISKLKLFMHMNDYELWHAGYDVGKYYEVCEKFPKKVHLSKKMHAKNLFDLNDESIKVA